MRSVVSVGLRPLRPIYAGVALDYLASGLGAPLPLPPSSKEYPPKGYTGREGVDPTPGTVKRWRRTRRPRSNVALPLAHGVLGIDVDAYGRKEGGATLTRLEQILGPLPPTVMSTNRGFGVSGIRFFRVPPDLRWKPALEAQQADGRRTSHIDIIQRWHRYALVWPSIHPEGRVYQWYDAARFVLGRVPSVNDLVRLPDVWVDFVKVPPPAPSHPSGAEPGVTRAPTPVHSRDGQEAVQEQCLTVRRAGEGERNEALNRAAFTLGRLSQKGHVEEQDAHQQLLDAALDAKLGCKEAQRTISSGWNAGCGGSS
jgi:hypothetical protein